MTEKEKIDKCMRVSVEVLEPCPCSWFADMHKRMHNTMPGVGMLSLCATWTSHATQAAFGAPQSNQCLQVVCTVVERCACEHKVSQMIEGLKRRIVSAPLAKTCIPLHVNRVSMEMQLTVIPC